VELSLISFLSLGFVLGLKHATDADHVAAVTTFVTHERSWLRSCWIGLFWGAGHTVSLAVAGVSVVMFKWRFPAWLEPRLELVVAAMLVTLGLRGMYLARKGGALAHSHLHLHGGGAAPHSHWHFHAGGSIGHETWLHVGLRPLLTGLIHGAAGSGALMVLVLSTIQSAAVSLLYVFIFGLGSIAGMILVSSIVALPARWFHSTQQFSRALQLGAGFFSCVLGVTLGLRLL
jgi:high-affinity nickel permease